MFVYPFEFFQDFVALQALLSHSDISAAICRREDEERKRKRKEDGRGEVDRAGTQGRM